MSSENVCPTVPPLYTWDSGTKDNMRDNSWDKPGTKSLKALAQAFLSVPSERDKVGQGAGQPQKSCPTDEAVVGQKTAQNSPSEEEVLSLEKYDTPTPEQITHANCMLVMCPVQGRNLHCWHCSRCGDTQTCKVWQTRRADVEFFRKSGPPFSLYLVETPGVIQ